MRITELNRSKALYYILAIGIFIFLKIAYGSADNNSLAFLLKPTNKLIELIYNSDSQAIAQNGYYHKKLNIVIDKSCSGFNFGVLCFIMLTFLALQYQNIRIYKIMILPLMLLSSYIFTIFANTSRILFSVVISKTSEKFITYKPDWLHQAEGAFVYLSFLIIIYLGFEYLFKKMKKNYAKLT